MKAERSEQAERHFNPSLFWREISLQIWCYYLEFLFLLGDFFLRHNRKLNIFLRKGTKF